MTGEKRMYEIVGYPQYKAVQMGRNKFVLYELKEQRGDTGIWDMVKLPAGCVGVETVPHTRPRKFKLIFSKPQTTVSQKPKQKKTKQRGRSEMKRKFEVGKVGWDNQNPTVPIVLLDKKTRKALGVDVRTLVKVTHGANKTVAMVHIQFWELVGTKKATLNSKLGKTLDANVGDKVTVDTVVTDEDKQQFVAQNHPLAPLFRALGGG